MDYSIYKRCDDKASSHILVVPFPQQGHLGPPMQLVYRLADHGLTITILTTEVHVPGGSLNNIQEMRLR
ncbi:conserved hypothetical protein [Ricinus communis]|uniref:UDP-glucosyltransferase n=1 Tax=Ricinus communis TaxID=3988 RepID=B9RLQ8_RICCO|nr:conserved hypothetical protein [Ricinus communis]